MKQITYIIILLACILTACSGSSTKAAAGDGDTVVLKYAKHLVIIKHDGYTQVDLKDPWKENKILHRYYLVSRDKENNPEIAQLKAHGDANVEKSSIVKVPAERVGVFTTVHTSLLLELGVKENIKGVADLKYMNLPWIHQQVKTGKIIDYGNAMKPDYEKMVESEPEIAIVSPFENNSNYGNLEQVGDVRIIEAADYMETSALGRAEWMKFYGMLFGKEKEANALFEKVDGNYQTLKAKAAGSKIHRSIITEMKVGSTWFVPGGQSVFSEMIKDAGGRYIFADNKDAGSLSYPFEKVLDEAGEADVWIYKYANHPATLQEIASDYHGYTEMKAWKTGEVFGCDTEKSLYFEEASFHPERVLLDLMIILQPELKLGYTRYYHKIQ